MIISPSPLWITLLRDSDKNSLDLLGWETVDAYNNEVSFLIKNIKTNTIIDNELFKIPAEEDL